MKFKIEYSKYINRELLKSTWEQFAEALRYCWKYDFKKVDFKQLDPRKLNFHQFGPRQFGAAVIKRIDQHVFAICIVILAVILSAVLIIKTVDLGITLAFTPYTVKKVVEKSKPTQQEIAAKFSALKKRAAEIKSTNYFCPAVKNAPPPPVVSGILGDKALVNGKWCGQGETSGDAVVKTISAAEVVVEWQGKEMKLAPINAPVAPQAPAAMNPAIPVQADASVPVMTNGEPAEVMKQMQRAQRTALINELRKNQNQFRRNRNNR